MRIPLALCLLVASMPALAAPRSVADCEKIQGADAYNQCLASFGPKPHQQHFTAAPPADEPSDKPTGGHGGRVHSQIVSRRGAHGRMHMEFFVGH